MADFKFGLHNKVWFLPWTAWDKGELPDYLFGEIVKRFRKNVDGAKRNFYEIWALVDDDGVYEVDEERVYSTLKELRDTVTGILMDELEADDREVFKCEEALKEAKKYRSLSKRMLKRWQKAEGTDQDIDDIPDRKVSHCPNCGFTLHRTACVATCADGLIGLWITCPKCGEDYAEWFKEQYIGSTMDDCIATIPHRFFYPAEGQTEESMVAAGVQKLGSVMKGGVS